MASKKPPVKAVALFPGGIRALNVGVAEFAESPRRHGATVVQLDWRPPAAGDRELGLLLARLEDDPDDPIGARVSAANARAVERILAARPTLIDVQPAADVVPGLGPRTILHAGPPTEWSRTCGPVRGAVIGAILFEGWADTPEAAQRLAEGGAIRFAPCHHFGAVGPMAGILCPSMPVVVVDMCVADSEGGVGYIIGNSLVSELGRRGLPDRVVCLLTQTVVAPKDPAFQHPSKPIGSGHSEADAKRKKREGWVMVTAGRRQDLRRRPRPPSTVAAHQSPPGDAHDPREPCRILRPTGASSLTRPDHGCSRVALHRPPANPPSTGTSDRVQAARSWTRAGWPSHSSTSSAQTR